MAKTRINPHLFKLKILDALKNSNIEQLTEIIKSIDTASNKDELDQVKGLILNLAVQVSNVRTIQLLLLPNENEQDIFNIDINHQDSDGNTPLHLVALNNRSDVAQLLLRDEKINDTLLNKDTKQPIELTHDLNMVALMQHERSIYIERVATKFKQAFINHDFATLDEILSSPRNYELLDINGYDPSTGDTVLHEFIKKNDIGMVQWILAHGGDPFKRDKKGKLPIDLIPKQNETLKQIIKDASQEQSVIDSTASIVGGMKAPTYKGYLRKWTNFASGYKLRWFILDSNGILSYYQSQDDTNNACRGSLNMKTASLHLDSSEKLKFEIIGKSGVRWHLKGNHPIETNRWVWSLQGAIRFSKDKEKAFEESLKRESQEQNNFDSNLNSTDLGSSSLNVIQELNEIKKPVVDHPHIVHDTDDDDDEEFDRDNEEDDDDKEIEGLFNKEDINNESGPYSQEISVLKSRFNIELNSLKELLVDLQRNSKNSNDETIRVSIDSVYSLINGFDKFNLYISKRDDKLLKALTKQRDVNELWINSIRDLENELVLKNSELETFETERRKIKKALNKRLTFNSALTTNSEINLPNDKHVVESFDSRISSELPSSSGTDLQPFPNDTDVDVANEISKYLHDDEDSEEEFFDADEFSDAEDDNEEVPYESDFTPQSPMKRLTLSRSATEISETPSSLSINKLQKQKHKLLDLEGSFKGYQDGVRTELPLKTDERPSVSLWGILKSMIGKDITKITLPVSFNEPTSMLQRIAEDLEYTELLDQAASEEDSTLRMLYVAAFAASEYSSTTNRVAKPFNPLLGETYEYARPDKGFRYFTEQVSHHPPVSAVIAEHERWDYYGETSVKSGFNGRSFDVQPTAKWYLHLRPDNGENEEEIYTWRKITSSVIGIMLGNPSIDNYGEMEITNNKTGDKCIINFKPRGWRSVNSYEMSGVVYDKEGIKHWAIGGHWNSKIYGKKIIDKHEIIDYTNKTPESSPNIDGFKFLMWQPTPRPEVPFNLTSYAISLNAPQPRLMDWIGPTDTRLRPDQRAMEDGRYDDASKFKEDVEDKQRKARKEREENGIAYKPLYFVKEIHPLTGEEYWRYTGDYWRLRNEKKLPPVDIF